MPWPWETTLPVGRSGPFLVGQALFDSFDYLLRAGDPDIICDLLDGPTSQRVMWLSFFHHDRGDGLAAVIPGMAQRAEWGLPRHTNREVRYLKEHRWEHMTSKADSPWVRALSDPAPSDVREDFAWEVAATLTYGLDEVEPALLMFELRHVGQPGSSWG